MSKRAVKVKESVNPSPDRCTPPTRPASAKSCASSCRCARVRSPSGLSERFPVRLPAISRPTRRCKSCSCATETANWLCTCALSVAHVRSRSEEHTSELQSHLNLVCRLLLEKKKNRQLADAV